MDRRSLLFAGGAMATLGRGALAAGEDLRGAAREAGIYCLPLTRMAGARGWMTRPGPASPTPRVNTFIHSRALDTPAAGSVSSPDVDTLRSNAWIDLSAGPAEVTLPAAGGRYACLALLDMFSNTISVLHAGSGPRRVLLAGPHGAPPPGAVRSPTPWVWAVGRTLADGPGGLAGAHQVQDGFNVRARPGREPEPGPRPGAPWNDYFLAAQQLLAENPPPFADSDMFRRIAPLQLGPGRGFENARFADVEADEIAAGLAQARAAVRGWRERPVGGWLYPKADFGTFGVDYLYRAAAAIADLGALPPTQALCLTAATPEGGDVFDGDHYRLTLPAPPPVDGFWSLTLYQVAADGRRSLLANRLGRYAIGDRTAGLSRGQDGSIDIWIGRADPGGARTANWLPAPAAGPFALVLRAYLPRRELLDGRYRVRPIEHIDETPSSPNASIGRAATSTASGSQPPYHRA